MDLAVGTDLAGTDMAEAADVVPAADLGQGVDLALDLPVGNAPSACGHSRQCCTDLHAPVDGDGGEDTPQGWLGLRLRVWHEWVGGERGAHRRQGSS